MKITMRNDSRQASVKFNKSDLIVYVYENIDMPNDYSLYIGEKGEFFYMQNNCRLQDADYLYERICNCGIDYSSFVNEDGEIVNGEEVKDFVIDQIVIDFIEQSGERYEITL